MLREKLWIVTLGFNRPDWCLEAIKECKRKNDLSRIDHEFVLVDCSYPMPNKKLNTAQLANAYPDGGFTYVKPYKNMGVAGGWTWAMNEMQMADSDCMLLLDPDSRPVHDGYAKALYEVATASKDSFYVGLNRPPFYDGWPRTMHEVAGYKCWEYHQLISWSFGLFNIGMVRKMGGFKQKHKLYGGCEESMWTLGRSMNLKALMLADFDDQHRESPDREYQAWKLASATTDLTDDFETWLKGKRMI